MTKDGWPSTLGRCSKTHSASTIDFSGGTNADTGKLPGSIAIVSIVIYNNNII
jgi:hypothetical protein